MRPDVNAMTARDVVFGIFGLTIFGIIIQSGGGWHLGVPEADNRRLRACASSPPIYLGFLVWCGCCVARMKKSPPGSRSSSTRRRRLAKV